MRQKIYRKPSLRSKLIMSLLVVGMLLFSTAAAFFALGRVEAAMFVSCASLVFLVAYIVLELSGPLRSGAKGASARPIPKLRPTKPPPDLPPPGGVPIRQRAAKPATASDVPQVANVVQLPTHMRAR